MDQNLKEIFDSSYRINMLGVPAEKWLNEFFFVNIVKYDIRKLKSRFSNVVYKLIKNKYTEVIKQKYNHIFKAQHPAYSILTKKEIDFNEYLKTKKKLYLDVLNYYNEIIVPFLQEYQYCRDIIYLNNYVFTPLPNLVEKINN